MGRCAFCKQIATLTGEHIWSEWMGELFPNQRHIFRRHMEGEPEIRTWESRQIDVTAKVVCADCNNGWMSNLESQHAKPAMRDLILSDAPVKLFRQRIGSIVAFAYKTAVIGNAMQRKRSDSFPKSVFSSALLRRFKSSLSVPLGFQVWLGCIGTDDIHNGVLRMRYAKAPVGAPNRFKLYACTFGLGRFLLQAVATEWTKSYIRRRNAPFIRQAPEWNTMAIPVWPFIDSRESFPWPPQNHLSDQTMDAFSDRWRRFTVPAMPVI